MICYRVDKQLSQNYMMNNNTYCKEGGGPGVGVRQKIPMQGKLSLILCAMFLQTIKEPSSSMNLVVLRSLTKSVRGVSVFLISILVYHSTCMTILSLTTGDCLLTVRHSCSQLICFKRFISSINVCTITCCMAQARYVTIK